MQARQEIERRLQEKEEEFENTRKNFARAMDSMQASLEGESKAKQEALRQVRRRNTIRLDRQCTKCRLSSRRSCVTLG